MHKKIYLITCIAIMVILVGAGCTNTQQAPIKQTQKLTDNSVTKQNQPQNIQTPPAKVICTNFEYSDWSRCNEEGQQYRTITEMYPSGCAGGNPVQSQKCEYKSFDFGTPSEYLDRIISQIRNAPNQIINSSYISGANGEMLQKLSYQILDDYFVIKSTLVHRDTNSAEPTVDFIDTDLDGFVDYWAGEDRIPHKIDKNGQEYSQIQTIWGIYVVNFANHHLIK